MHGSMGKWERVEGGRRKEEECEEVEGSHGEWRYAKEYGGMRERRRVRRNCEN